MHLLVRQEPVQRIDAGNRLAVMPDNDIALQDTSTLGRTMGLNGHHEDPTRDWQVLQTHEAARQRHILPAYPNITAPDSAVFDEASSHEDGGVHRDGETEALGLQDDRGVDANHLALRGHQGTTRVSWVEGCVRLNNIIDKPSPAGP